MTDYLVGNSATDFLTTGAGDKLTGLIASPPPLPVISVGNGTATAKGGAGVAGGSVPTTGTRLIISSVGMEVTLKATIKTSTGTAAGVGAASASGSFIKKDPTAMYTWKSYKSGKTTLYRIFENSTERCNNLALTECRWLCGILNILPP